MSNQFPTAKYEHGTHAATVHQQQIAASQAVFSAAAFAAAPGPPTNFVPRGQIYRSGTHSEAIHNAQIAAACAVFSPPINPVVSSNIPQPRDFCITDQELPLQAPSWVQNNTPFLVQGTPVQNPLPRPVIQTWPQEYQTQVWSQVFAPPLPAQPAPPPMFVRVQATGIGQYNDVYYAPGDVFDVATIDFADSTIDYTQGHVGTPMFGWMMIVPPTTPLTYHTGIVFDFTSKRRTVF